MVNGIYAKNILRTREIRQVFPLSPLLYITMAKNPNRTLEREIIEGRLEGILIVRGVNFSMMPSLWC